MRDSRPSRHDSTGDWSRYGPAREHFLHDLCPGDHHAWAASYRRAAVLSGVPASGSTASASCPPTCSRIGRSAEDRDRTRGRKSCRSGCPTASEQSASRERRSETLLQGHITGARRPRNSAEIGQLRTASSPAQELLDRCRISEPPNGIILLDSDAGCGRGRLKRTV